MHWISVQSLSSFSHLSHMAAIILLLSCCNLVWNNLPSDVHGVCTITKYFQRKTGQILHGDITVILWIRACLYEDKWTANRSLWPNIKGWRRMFHGFKVSTSVLMHWWFSVIGWLIMTMIRCSHFLAHEYAFYRCSFDVFSRPYYWSRYWYSVASVVVVCLFVVCKV